MNRKDCTQQVSTQMLRATSMTNDVSEKDGGVPSLNCGLFNILLFLKETTLSPNPHQSTQHYSLPRRRKKRQHPMKPESLCSPIKPTSKTCNSFEYTGKPQKWPHPPSRHCVPHSTGGGGTPHPLFFAAILGVNMRGHFQII